MYILSRYLALVLLPFLWVICPPNAAAQTVVATVTAGGAPEGVAVNTVTNKIYVANFLSSNVTVIDGTTNSTTTVPAGVNPVAVAVNETTNKIYVANRGDCGPFGRCRSSGSITVIDGATNSTTTVNDPNANGPFALATNSVTNKIYVANFWSSNITVIDGATNSITTVTDPNANGLAVYAVAVNQVTDKIYALNNNTDRPGSNPGSVTVIDGATNSVTTVTDPNAFTPFAVAVNTVTNKVYVANEGNYPGFNHGNVTVIDGTNNSVTTLTDSNALAPVGVAVNQTANKIYVADANDSAVTGNGGVTVIDGATNSLSFVSAGPNSHILHAVALDSVTNTIYLTSEGCFPPADPCRNPGSVTVINGATHAVTTIIDPSAHNPEGVTVNGMTDKIYVANVGSSNVTVIDGGAIPTSHTLSVVLEGSGSGTVTSSPAGINCTMSCTASFADGTAVDLTASPSSGVTFSGWSTNCSGTGACNVTMSSDDFVTATFNTGQSADFSLTPTSTNLTTQRGGQVTDAITLAPQNGSFASAIQLSCTVSGPSPMPTCGLSPASVTPGANSASSTLTITAPAASALLQPAIHGQLKFLYAAWLPLPGIVLFGVGLIFRKQRDRRRNLLLLTGSLLALFAVLAGCGGGGGQQTQPQNYTVTVTGTSGAIQHTTQVTVTVQ